MTNYDVIGIGNAIVDVIFPATDDFLLKHTIAKSVMTLIDEFRAGRIVRVIRILRVLRGVRIARVLARHGINLQLAKVSTLGERVEDTFLIEGPELQDNSSQLRMETELLKALAQPG